MPSHLQTYIHVIILNMLAPVMTAGIPSADEHPALPISHTSIAAYHRSMPRISEILAIKRLTFGSPVFIRIFKQENELELWVRNDQTYTLYKTYIICFKSGDLGPKTEEGDRQSPEGFYHVGTGQMNPWSDFHLAFNVGYPNDYDRFYQRTGSALMVHGRCSSDGCFAMTDYYMDEIYTLVNEALAHGQSKIQVHIFPFRLENDVLETFHESPWYSFWLNLKEGYDFFQDYQVPPSISSKEGRYIISSPPPLNSHLARDVQKNDERDGSTL